MTRTPDEQHSIVNARLRYVDVLVKAGRYGDAVKEIAEIKQVEPANPYVQAYEERLKTLGSTSRKESGYIPADTVDQARTERKSNAPQGTAKEIATEEFAHNVMGYTQELSHIAERRQPNVPDSSDGIQISADPHSRGKGTIVLVDDDELMLEALVELFEENKYRTKSFTKSEDALEYVKGHRPDLVLSDVNLRSSSFGGFTLFEKMTKLGHLHNVPFVFMSGLVDEAVIRAGKELGADDYLTKPFEPDMLLAVVKGKLRKYKFAETNH